MARLLDCPDDRIPLLIDLGLLIEHTKEGEGWRRVYCPSGPTIRWIKAMLLPLPERPLFRVSEVLALTELSHGPKRNSSSPVHRPHQLFHRLCAAYAIPLHVDPRWGELMSPSSLIRFLDALHGYRQPMRFDRAALVTWLRGMQPKSEVKFSLPYSKLIEAEIARIVRLDEPERTVRAVALWESYRDAKMLSQCMGDYRVKVREQMSRVERRLKGMMRKVTGQKIHLPHSTPTDPTDTDVIDHPARDQDERGDAR